MVLVLAVIAAGSSADANDQDALRELSKQLRYVRSLAPDANVDTSCPEKALLARLRGLTKSEVLAQLSDPDSEEENTNVWSYFVTSQTEGVIDRGDCLEVTTGGGFPIITFVFNPRGRAERVTCAYAR
jgi:hypothetical protein